MINITPAGYRVLVRLKKTDKKVDEVSEGGIILETNVDVEAHQYATQEAYVEKLGITAFKSFDEGDPWCKVGDLVLIAKYSGENRKDLKTGEIYRVINDQDIIAILEEQS